MSQGPVARIPVTAGFEPLRFGLKASETGKSGFRAFRFRRLHSDAVVKLCHTCSGLARPEAQSLNPSA